MPSPRSSLAARSPSGDDAEDVEKAQPRRTRSSQDEIKEDPAAAIDDEADEESEEEVTRCICGSLEYPGLPVTSTDATRQPARSDANSSLLSEDSTGWFIQCDKCKVWQHGGCVGIMDESTSPEEYFCEQCRKDLHRISTDLKGRRYSLYLPVQEKTSDSTSPEPLSKTTMRRSRETRGERANADSVGKGRRATMNSRDSAYDEAEQLRRAIEESKRESAAAINAAGSRKGKRSRSASEEGEADAKRRRTTSGSSSSHSKNRQQGEESEEEIDRDTKGKNIRGAAARNQKAKQERERASNRDVEKLDQASKRNARSEKRRSEDSDQSPEPESRTTSKGGQSSEKSIPPPPPPESLPSKIPHQKKTGRPPARRGRIGRNQYTRDRDINNHEAIPRSSPAHSNNSQDGDGGPSNGTSVREAFLESYSLVGRPSKPRHMNPNRTTMNDMKRRVAGILEFISHTQVEMAGLDTPITVLTNHENGNKTSNAVKSLPSHANNTSNGMAVAKGASRILQDLDSVDPDTFMTLNSVEMMEVLTRRLMRWQGEFGKWGEK